jgi:uncharacterized LabA/DUF88 family protein
MRSHSALYIDAGYLIAAAATRTTGSSLRRSVNVDYAKLIDQLITLVESDSGLPLLRVYWYDAARNGVADQDQEQIAILPRVKLRLGRIGVEGEQKGVDLRIGLDMVGHSRNGAIDSVYLLSGDDDLTEAVEEAQAQGVQVTIVAVPTNGGLSHGVSRHLLRAADALEVISEEVLDNAVSSIGAPSKPPALLAAPAAVAPVPAPNPANIARRAAAATPLAVAYRGGPGTQPYIAPEHVRTPEELTSTIDEVVRRTYDAWAAAATPSQHDELSAGRPSIPRDLDRALLFDLSAALGDENLSDPVRFNLRARFWENVADR